MRTTPRLEVDPDSNLLIRMQIISVCKRPVVRTGIKLLDDSYYSSLDVTESKSLGYKTNTVDIYSNSWGPRNTGWSFHGPGTLTAMTLEKGAKEVRYVKCLTGLD